MSDFTQSMIDSIDMKTEEGFAEALMIAISSLKDKNGLLLRVRLSEDPTEMIDFAMQIARMMLHKENT